MYEGFLNTGKIAKFTVWPNLRIHPGVVSELDQKQIITCCLLSSHLTRKWTQIVSIPVKHQSQILVGVMEFFWPLEKGLNLNCCVSDFKGFSACVRYLVCPCESSSLICLHTSLNAFHYSLSLLLATPHRRPATSGVPHPTLQDRKWKGSFPSDLLLSLGLQSEGRAGRRPWYGPDSQAEQRRARSDVTR